MQGFDRARPLWEVVVVEGLEDGRAALILKLHHSITDGVGGVKIAMNLFDLERDGADRRADARRAAGRSVLSQLQRVVDALDHERRRQLGIARRSRGTLAGGHAAPSPTRPGTRRRGRRDGGVGRAACWRRRPSRCPTS